MARLTKAQEAKAIEVNYQKGLSLLPQIFFEAGKIIGSDNQQMGCTLSIVDKSIVFTYFDEDGDEDTERFEPQNFKAYTDVEYYANRFIACVQGVKDRVIREQRRDDLERQLNDILRRSKDDFLSTLSDEDRELLSVPRRTSSQNEWD